MGWKTLRKGTKPKTGDQIWWEGSYGRMEFGFFKQEFIAKSSSAEYRTIPFGARVGQKLWEVDNPTGGAWSGNAYFYIPPSNVKKIRRYSR